jgi:hypothetical protein
MDLVAEASLSVDFDQMGDALHTGHKQRLDCNISVAPALLTISRLALEAKQ